MPNPFSLPQFGPVDKQKNPFDLPQFSGKISDTNKLEARYIETLRAEANAAEAKAKESTSLAGKITNFSNTFANATIIETRSHFS